MSKEKDRHRDRAEDGFDEDDRSSKRTVVDRDERDEYAEWRRERGKRGRKRKDKAGGRHRQRRRDEEY